MSLAHTIRAQRQAQGLTQGELGKAVHRSRATIAQYERGYAIPPLAVVRRMARVFQCSLQTLLADEMEEAPCPTTPTAPAPIPQP